MPELRKSEEYTVTVTELVDGDTVAVEFDDGMTENVRVLGIDTPEKQEFQRFERTEEWVGIDTLPTLATWADRATEYARDLLGGKGTSVTLSFDAAAPLRAADAALVVSLPTPESLRDAAKTTAMARALDARIAGAVVTRTETPPEGVERLLNTDQVFAVPDGGEDPLASRAVCRSFRRLATALPG